MTRRSTGPTRPRSTPSSAATAPSALRLATVVLGTRDGADDVVQVAMDAGVVGVRRATTRTDRSVPWFLRIVANTARNDRRQRGRQAALRVRAERDRGDVQSSAEDDVLTVLDRTRVLAALNHLDVDDRTVIALRYFEQLAEAEMAEVLDCRRAP